MSVLLNMSTLTDDEWQEYKQKHNKVYNGEAEEQRRRAIVEQRKKIIEEHNKKYKAGIVTYTGRLNSMSDYTEEERSRMHGFKEVLCTKDASTCGES